MNELFPEEEVRMDSPMLAWKKKHGVYTSYFFGAEDGWLPWLASFGEPDGTMDPDACGFGKTEEEAMRDLAYIHRHKGIKCWNEE